MIETAPHRTPDRSRIALLCLAATPFLLVELFNDQLYRVMGVSAYLLFHNVVEFFSVMVSLSIFGLAWFSFDQSRDRHALFLGVAFLAIGMMDFMHALSYAGMPDLITPNTVNRATLFWIAARLFSAAAFLGSAFVPSDSPLRWINRPTLITAALIACLLVFAGIVFFPDKLPVAFVPDVGLTPFKRVSEYVIILIFALAAALYWRRLARPENRRLSLCFLPAFVLCIFSELFFTLYKSAFDTYNLLGHIYKVVAFFLIYRGIFVNAIKKPYSELSLVTDDLRRTHDVLLSIINSVPQSIFWKDLNLAFLGCNREFARQAGVADPDQIIGKTDFDLPWGGQEAEAYRADDREVMTSGRPKLHIIETQHQADGSVIWLDTSKIPLLDGTGRVWAVLGVYGDITGQKLAEEQLRDALAFSQEIITSAREGVVVYDRELCIKVWNPCMEELSGLPASDVLGRRPQELFSDFRESGLEERLEQVLAGRQLPVMEFPRQVLASGRDGWLSDASAPLRNGSGEIIGVIATMRDITQRRLLEEQLRQSQKLESVGRLAAGVAHDFNNKLTVILGYAELTRMGSGDDQVQEYQAQIIRAAEQARSITAQLLAFSRQQAASPRPLDANVVLGELHTALGRLIGEDISIAIVPANELCLINIDPVQLDQIIMNLAVNARDAMPEGGTITVEIDIDRVSEETAARYPGTRPGEYVRIRFSDNGTGMDAETRAHIFEPFFTTKEPGKGTGLGLATVYGLVTQNGGFIDVESTPGSGTTFTICLPRHLPGEGAAEAPERQDNNRRESGTILLVEDEEPVRRVSAALLESLGYTCIPAAGPQEALEIARDRRIALDLVLTDLLMPGMNGKEMMAQLRGIRPGIRCAFMSGFRSDIIVAGTGDGEKQIFIKKPFRVHEIAAIIRQAMGR
jgi:PAS domain S-box-containing protein